MNLFTENHCLKKYGDVYGIVDDYFIVRKKAYIKRKESMIKQMEYLVKKLSNKAKFILEQCEDIIDLRKKKKDEVIELLKNRHYDILDGDNEYKYLRTMKIEQVEEENMNKLLKEENNKIKELNILKNTTIEKMWLGEIDELDNSFKKYQIERMSRQMGIKMKKTKKKSKNK